MSNTNTHKGKVKFFNEAKGFGFIKDNLDSKEYFIHVSNVKSEYVLQENDEVEFEIGEGKKGPQAENVVLV